MTGQVFASPVPPGTGWPGDPATAETPIAHTAAQVRRLAASAEDVAELDARVSVCRACRRLVRWRESVAREGRRAAFADQPYWGRPGPGFGDPEADVLVVGLAPAANGTNRTGRIFTGDRSGDWLYAALHRAGYASQPESWASGDGQSLRGIRIVAAVRCAPPENRTHAGRARDLWAVARPRARAGSTATAIGTGPGRDRVGGHAGQRAEGRLGGATAGKPRFGHGAETLLTTPEGRPVRLVGSYHVSQQNTFTGKLTEGMLDDVVGRLGQPLG